MRGFTLVELVVVVALLALLGLTLVPALFPADTELRLDAAGHEVAAALRFARAEAMRTGTAHGARVQAADERVRVFRLEAGIAPAERFDVLHPVDQRLYDVDLDDGPFTSGVGVEQAAFRFGASLSPAEAVAFDPRGEPVSPVDATPLASGTVGLGYRGSRRDVVLAPGSGRVSVE